MGGHGGAQVPEDIPDGADDDIVARQLREAAEKEQDPELREKLWKEYRKYKGIPEPALDDNKKDKGKKDDGKKEAGEDGEASADESEDDPAQDDDDDDE